MVRTRKNKDDDITENYNRDEINYFKSLDYKQRDNIIKIEKDLNNINNSNIPLRFKFLLSKTTMENKKVMLNKLNELKMTSRCGGESAKLHKMISVLSQIPFGIYHNIKYDNINNFK